MLNNDPVIKNRVEILERNKAIRKEFAKLKKEGKKAREIWQILSEKHFTGIENIKRILYK